MLTFLHAADLHLDALFHALPPDRAAERRREQRQLLTRLAQVAQQAQVDLVFLCGDLFDSQRVRPETLQALHQVLEEMEAPVFLAPGNHDPYTDASPYGSSPGPATSTSSPPPPRSGWPCPSWGRWSTAAPSPPPPPDGGAPHRLPRPGGGGGGLRLLPRGPLLPPQPVRAHHPRGDRRLGAELPGPGPHPRRQRPPAGGENLLRLARLPRGPGL